MLLLETSLKLLNFITYLHFWSLFVCSTLIRWNTKHFTLVILLIFAHSYFYFPSNLGQLVHHLSSHFVALQISLVSRSLTFILIILSYCFCCIKLLHTDLCQLFHKLSTICFSVLSSTCLLQTNSKHIRASGLNCSSPSTTCKDISGTHSSLSTF